MKLKADQITIFFKDKSGRHIPATVVKARKYKAGMSIWACERKAQQPVPEDLTPLEETEMRCIEEALEKHDYNKNQTRKYLGITVNTLVAKMHKYGLVKQTA